jgi:polyisoprenoid-binding protein YceI
MTREVATAFEHYEIDAPSSTVLVQAFAEGLFSAFGHDPVLRVQEFSGSAQLVAETLERASLKLSFNAGSLSVVNDVKQTDRIEIERMTREQVLEVDKFPEIVFESSNITLSRLRAGRYRARVIGTLMLHGVTQSNVWINGELTVTPDGLRAKGEFPIKQKDYQIQLVSVVGGTLKIKNEVKCSFDVVARKASDML